MSERDSICASEEKPEARKNGHRFRDLTGMVFGNWTVIAFDRVHDKSRRLRWKCRCSCGEVRSVIGGNLTRGLSISCGCIVPAIVRAMKVTHGQARKRAQTVEYKTWLGMKKRCENRNSKFFKHYGGRGIIICERWQVFSNFFEDMGARPSSKHSIDRINNNGNYEPGNCRWATDTEQAENQRRSVYVLIDGNKLTQSQAARLVGVSEGTIHRRIKSGKIQRA